MVGTGAHLDGLVGSAVGAQNNLQQQFWGDYNTVESDLSGAWFISTDSRHGLGCPAVDAYQRYLVDNGLVIEEDEQEGAAPHGKTTPRTRRSSPRHRSSARSSSATPTSMSPDSPRDDISTTRHLRRDLTITMRWIGWCPRNLGWSLTAVRLIPNRAAWYACAGAIVRTVVNGTR